MPSQQQIIKKASADAGEISVAEVSALVQLSGMSPFSRAAGAERLETMVLSRFEIFDGHPGENPGHLYAMSGFSPDNRRVDIITSDPVAIRYAGTMADLDLRVGGFWCVVPDGDGSLLTLKDLEPSDFDDFLDRATVPQLLAERGRLVHKVEIMAAAGDDSRELLDLLDRISIVEDELIVTHNLDIDLDLLCGRDELAEMAADRARRDVLGISPILNGSIRGVPAIGYLKQFSGFTLQTGEGMVVDHMALARDMLDQNLDLAQLRFDQERLTTLLGYNPAEVYETSWRIQFESDFTPVPAAEAAAEALEHDDAAL